MKKKVSTIHTAPAALTRKVRRQTPLQKPLHLRHHQKHWIIQALRAFRSPSCLLQMPPVVQSLELLLLPGRNLRLRLLPKPLLLLQQKARLCLGLADLLLAQRGLILQPTSPYQRRWLPPSQPMSKKLAWISSYAPKSTWMISPKKSKNLGLNLSQ